MKRIRHFAAAGVLGVAFAAGLNGCANRNHDIPDNAVVLTEGKGDTSAMTTHGGSVYVWDDTKHKMLYSGAVANGDRIRIDPRGDKITLNGKTVSQQPIDVDHKF